MHYNKDMRSLIRQPWFFLLLFIALCAGVYALVSLLSHQNTATQQSKSDTHVEDVRQEPTPPPAELPLGGRTLFPDYRLIALYGVPDQPALGVLGAQSRTNTFKRVKKLAAQYQPYSKEKIMPALEIIATVASASPTDNRDYSLETDVSRLKPWIISAKKEDIYVVLDLQPGRRDFLSQAKTYTELLKQPNVGLALDPEWRLKPNQTHLNQIGSVSVDEVNKTAAWLANLTAEHQLPQKVFLLHQFRTDMIINRSKLDTTHPELAYIIQMDGSGTQSQKESTWRDIRQNAPKNVKFGWKNFYKEDSATLSQKDTMSVTPKPWYVSYQ
jgi:hypothetical protein